MIDKYKFPDIHSAYVAFLDIPSNGKSRPILIIGQDGEEVLVYQLTSQAPKTDFQKATRYEIIYWKEAGLDKKTYVKFYPEDKRRLPSSQILAKKGSLLQEDVNNLLLKISKFNTK